MRITIIGGGNIGTLMAAEMAHHGHNVTVYTKRADKWSKNIKVLQPPNRELMDATLYSVTSSLKDAVSEADLTWVTVPASMFRSLSDDLLPLINEGQYLGIVPGSGGAEFAFYDLIRKGCILFGLQRVHSIARVLEYGHSVFMLGRKTELQLSSIPRSKCDDISAITENLFNIPCRSLPCYLNLTLTPSNPILHTTRLYSMFRNYDNKTIYPHNIRFYEEWDMHSSKNLIEADEELQSFCKILPFDLSAVISLKKHYESDTVESMTEKIRDINAFKGILSPMKEVSGGWQPDFSSRYFSSDFSYGLKVILEIAKAFDFPMPKLSSIWNWYKKLYPSSDDFSLCLSKNDIVKIYSI